MQSPKLATKHYSLSSLLISYVVVFASFVSALFVAMTEMNAQEATNEIWECRITPSISLRDETIFSYRIKAKNLPPEGDLRPGQTYQIRYQIHTDCGGSCVDIKPTFLHVRQVLGDDPSPLHTTATISKMRIEQHDCETTQTRIVTFTVPNVIELGYSGRGPATVTMGVCPKYHIYSCAAHMIQVQASTVGGWSITAIKPQQRAIGNGVNRVGTSSPITLATIVTNKTNSGFYPEPSSKIVLWQVLGPGLNVEKILQTKPLGGMGRDASKTYTFEIGRLFPGTFAFKACLTGLKEVGSNWPLPPQCGPVGAVTSGVHSADYLRITPPAVGGNKSGNSVVSSTSFLLQANLHNTSNKKNPVGSGNAILWQRLADGSQPAVRNQTKTIKRLPASGALNLTFKLIAPSRNALEYKICVSDIANAPITDSVCSQWSKILLENGRVENNHPTPAVSPSCGDPTREKANGSCCPSGSVARLNRCVRKRELSCNAPFVPNKAKTACVCKQGYGKFGNRCVKRSAKRPALICPKGARKKANTCVCRRPAIWREAVNKCSCPRGLVYRAGRCVRK